MLLVKFVLRSLLPIEKFWAIHSQIDTKNLDCSTMYNLLAEKSFTDSPCDGRSEGFNSPEQCLHKSLGVRCRISFSLWLMYCFHTLSFLIQHRAVVESLRRTVGYSAPTNFNLLTSQAKINAPSNSNRGIVCSLIGATLDFDATNLTLIRTSLYVFGM